MGSIIQNLERVACALVLLLAGTTPALANSVTLPDPSGLTLFSLGVAGLIFGRRIASRRRKDD